MRGTARAKDDRPSLSSFQGSKVGIQCAPVCRRDPTPKRQTNQFQSIDMGGEDIERFSLILVLQTFAHLEMPDRTATPAACINNNVHKTTARRRQSDTCGDDALDLII
jgi:hypothetical protein